MDLWLVIVIVIGAVIVTAIVSCVITRRKDVGKVTYMLDALEDGETNFRFKDRNLYNRTLNRLNLIFRKQRVRNEQESWSKLIRTLTHEIMNTLAPVISISESLQKGIEAGQEDTAHVKEGLDIINESSNNLKRFIEDYRRLSGLNRPAYTEVSMKDFIGGVIALHREMLASHGCEINYVTDDETMVVKIDEGQITQVLINLIKNALQAGAKKIEITGRGINDSGTYLQVYNDGEPIKRDTADMIFVPFFTTKNEGTGIGLSISRQIMQQHKGSIELLRSNPNETVFELHFP